MTGVDTDEAENVEDVFRGALKVEESVLVVEFEVAEALRNVSDVGDIRDAFLRII